MFEDNAKNRVLSAAATKIDLCNKNPEFFTQEKFGISYASYFGVIANNG